MNLLKKQFLILLASAGLLAGTAAAETRVGGEITGNVEWTKAGSPYIVTADVIVKEGARLTIGPGVLVRFKPNLADQKGLRPFDLELTVYGTLECRGADGDSINFTSDALEPDRQDWAGIVVPRQGAVARIDRVIMDCATTAVTVQDGGEVQVTNSHIRFCSERGIHFIRGRGRLVNNYITNIGNFAGSGKGVYLVQSPDVEMADNIIEAQFGVVLERGSDIRMTGNTLANCRYYGLAMASSSPRVTGNNITNNEYGIQVRGHSRPEVRDNNIFNNATWEVQVKEYRSDVPGQKAELDFTGNWWGRVTADFVYDRIEDGIDLPELEAIIKIEPARPEAYRPR